jgi:hypothetical protein
VLLGVNLDLSPAGGGRMVIALAVLAALAFAAWLSMEAGKFQTLTWILLGFFALRVVLGWLRSRNMEYDESVRSRDRDDV